MLPWVVLIKIHSLRGQVREVGTLHLSLSHLFNGATWLRWSFGHFKKKLCTQSNISNTCLKIVTCDRFIGGYLVLIDDRR